MLNDLLRKLNSLWIKLAPREKRLALAVAALAAAMMVLSTVRGSLAHLKMLDDTIERLQDQIVYYHDQMARKQSVEAHYSRVAAQHSSKWTEPEIQDRLRQELYRLAQKMPPGLDAKGIPLRTTGDSGDLVKIPTLGQGTLTSGGEDFREFKLNFQIPYTERQPLFDFLERLQGSPQSLRIDRLEIARDAISPSLRASIDITRILVAGVPEMKDKPVATAPAASGDPALDPAAWKGAGVDIAFRDDGPNVVKLELRAATDKALALRVENLPAGAAYDLYLDMSASGAGTIAISDETGTQEFSGGAPLRDDGAPYRYHLQFTAPGGPGISIPLCVPCIRLNTADTVVAITKYVLKKAME